MLRTIKLKLNIPLNSIQPTLDLYSTAFNYVCQVGFEDRDFNGVSLHHKTYYKSRELFNLPSELAISSRMKATETLKPAIKRLNKNQPVSCPTSKSCSIRYDKNSFSINFIKNEISLLTINGRIKTKFQVPQYFQKYLTWRRKSAELFIRNKKVFINICFEKITSEIISNNQYIGIDLGINKPAVLSNNKFYKGGKIKRICKKYQTLHSKLQSCGSKSAKRHLKKISKKENRFKTDTNHCISKDIINSLKPGTTIILEQLKYIAEKNKSFNKQFNKKLHSWAFFQLQQFLTYKAENKSIAINYVSAKYTSQKCSKCGNTSKENRLSQPIFKCKKCNFQINADLNAAKNIRQNYLDTISYLDGAAINQPIVTP